MSLAYTYNVGGYNVCEHTSVLTNIFIPAYVQIIFFSHMPTFLALGMDAKDSDDPLTLPP